MPDYGQMVNALMALSQQGNSIMPVAMKSPLQNKLLDPRGGSEGAIGYGGGRWGPSGRYDHPQELLNDPGYVTSRIRQIEYDRRLAGHKVDGKYPPHGELMYLRSRLKELLAGQ